MASQLYNNVSDSLLSSISNSQNSFDLTEGNIPSVDPGDYIPIHVVRSSDNAFEIMHVTEVSGSTITVLRTQEGTDPLTFNAGDLVQIRPTRQSLLEMDTPFSQSITSPGGAALVGNVTASFNILSQLLSADWVSIGDIVSVTGRRHIFDKGGNDYEIIPAGTGTDDGGSYIDLPGSGLQAKALFRNSNEINLKQFGAVGDGLTDDLPAIEAALAYYPTTIDFQSFREKRVIDGGGAIYGISSPLSFTRRGINLRRFGLKAVGGGWTPSQFLLEIGAGARHNQIDGVNFHCEKVANGIHFSNDGNYNNLLENLYIYNYVDYGIKVDANSNINYLNNISIEGLLSSDPEAEDEVNYTGTGLYIASNDVKVEAVTSSKCLYPLHLDGATFCLISNSHFWNGAHGSGATAVPWSGDSIIIKCSNGAANVSLSGCYLDGGYTDIDGDCGAIIFTDSVYLVKSDATNQDSYFRFVATATGQELPPVQISEITAPNFKLLPWISFDESLGSFADKPTQTGATPSGTFSTSRGRHSFLTTDAGAFPVELVSGGAQCKLRLVNSGYTGWIGLTGSALQVDSPGAFTPSQDNTTNLGNASNRWSQVFSANGAISTSDGRYKTSVEDLTDAEIRVGAKLRVRRYKMNSAIESKGDNARWHIGFIAQEVIEAFQSEGINPFLYGAVCHDIWDEEEEIKDEDGYVMRPYKPAGDRYSLRYDELYALMMAAARG